MICALGRFDRLLDVRPPDEADREDIFRIHTRSIPCSPDVDLNELARLTEGYTGADIKLVCREAAVAALDVCYLLFPHSGTLGLFIFSLKTC
jgi:AAA family ATPase